MYSKSDSNKMSKFSKKSTSSKRLVNNKLVEKELTILRNLLPTVNKPNVSKLVVINEAIRYIDQLEQQVLLKYAIYQRLLNQRSINNERRHVQQIVISQTKLKKTQPKRIEKK